MKVLLGADHRGVQLKQMILESGLDLNGTPVEFVDVGAKEYVQSDDYPDYAKLLVTQLRSGESYGGGILICGSGAGISIAANKFRGIRCTIGINPDQVRSARSDDNVNILALAADYTNVEAAVIMIKVFLGTEYSKLPRHTNRIEKIQQIEEQELQA